MEDWTAEELSALVDGGAAKLTEFRPGWFSLDYGWPVDLGKLSVSSPYDCPVAQVFYKEDLLDSPWEEGLRIMGIRESEAWQYGFDYRIRTTSTAVTDQVAEQQRLTETLNTLWVRKIISMREFEAQAAGHAAEMIMTAESMI